jgi:hypothetical protein
MNNSNLIPQNMKTKSEQRETARKGGIASGEARRRKRNMKQALELLLSLPLKDPKAKKKIEELGVDPNEIDNQTAILIAMMNKAVKGSESAFIAIRDTVGDKQTEKIESNNNISLNYEELIKEIKK